MKRLTLKIVFTLMIIFGMITLSANIITLFAIQIVPDTIVATHNEFSFIVMISGSISLILFAIVINYMIVSRIKQLNIATKEIAKGNFDTVIIDKHNDELAGLIHNFNFMTKELKTNAYLSKEFVRNVSHEFKTPISSIKGYAELLENGMLTEEETKEYARIIVDETERFSSLSKNLLQLSLIDSSNIIKKEDIFLLDEQIRKVLQVTQYLWEEKNLEFDLNLEKITFMGNKELTYQIWQNLISNAIKFSAVGGIINISLVRKESSVMFEIEDFGVGISDENKEKIFMPFYIADKSRNKQGSGLGLSITKKIVDKLDGEIVFYSEENKGTRFVVTLKD